MVDEPENLASRMLRSLDEKMDTVFDRLLDLTARVSSAEDQLVGVRADLVRLEHRINHLDQRVQRIDRRLSLTEA